MLGELLFLIEGVPSVVDGSGSEVTNELSFSSVVTHDEFEEEDQGEKLDPSSLRDGGQAPAPEGMEAKVVPSKSMFPGRRIPAYWVTNPRKASMETRPCLSSVYRSWSNRSWEALLSIPRGS